MTRPISSELTSALAQVRAAPPSEDGTLGVRLADALKCSPDELHTLLRKHQGIAVLSDAEFNAALPHAARLPCDPPGWRMAV